MYLGSLTLIILGFLVFSFVPLYSDPYTHSYSFNSDSSLGHAMVTNHIDTKTIFDISLSTTDVADLSSRTLRIVMELNRGPISGSLLQAQIMRDYTLNSPNFKTQLSMDDLGPISLKSDSWVLMKFIIVSSELIAPQSFELEINWYEGHYSYELAFTYIIIALLFFLPVVSDRFARRKMIEKIQQETEDPISH